MYTNTRLAPRPAHRICGARTAGPDCRLSLGRASERATMLSSHRPSEILARGLAPATDTGPAATPLDPWSIYHLSRVNAGASESTSNKPSQVLLKPALLNPHPPRLASKASLQPRFAIYLSPAGPPRSQSSKPSPGLLVTHSALAALIPVPAVTLLRPQSLRCGRIATAWRRMERALVDS